MPYIKKERRKVFDKHLISVLPLNKGELNYCVTRLAVEFMANQEESYQTISDAINALRDAAGEIERRVLQPYEDEKIIENGEIVSYQLERLTQENNNADISSLS